MGKNLVILQNGSCYSDIKDLLCDCKCEQITQWQKSLTDGEVVLLCEFDNEFVEKLRANPCVMSVSPFE